MNSKRRGKMEIIADLLRLDEVTKTQIMYGVGFNSHRTEEYVEFLLRKGFLEKIEGGTRTTYRATAAGKQLMKQIDELSQLLS